ncbi:hypothetical protein [Pseudactinotalea sp.]|uniref:hypothetical protein n=1 Tax=Pseudactinotalea sp. TaxID=1926260 RepID=UPI003B39FDFE
MPEFTFTTAQRHTLVRLLRAAYPHPTFPDGPFERTAEAVVAKASENTWDALALATGLDSLDARAGGDFGSLGEEVGEKVLREIADAPFFRMIRGVAVVSLYDDHEVWQLLGYEGASFDAGGYLHRGFDDLAWLPDPRIEEYDGPDHLVEVAAEDEVEGAGA